MPVENTRGDLVRLYLSGAASDGGAQADPQAALGNYRSSTEFDGLGAIMRSIIPGLRIDHVAHGNGIGVATLHADGPVAWTPPGGTRGPYVTIANGQTRVLHGLGDPGAYVRVTQTRAIGLDGSATVDVVDIVHGLWDLVTNTERAAGDTEYRCIVFKCGAGGSALDLRFWLALLGTAQVVNSSGYAASGAVTVTCKDTYEDWPESGYVENEDTGEVLYYSSRTDTALTVPAGGRDVWTDVAGGAAGSEDDALRPLPGLRIALEAPSAQPAGFFQTIADEDTAPTGLTFKHPTSAADADARTLDKLAPGHIGGLWIERKVPAGAVGTYRADTEVAYQYLAAE